MQVRECCLEVQFRKIAAKLSQIVVFHRCSLGVSQHFEKLGDIPPEQGGLALGLPADNNFVAYLCHNQIFGVPQTYLTVHMFPTSPVLLEFFEKISFKLMC